MLCIVTVPHYHLGIALRRYIEAKVRVHCPADNCQLAVQDEALLLTHGFSARPDVDAVAVQVPSVDDVQALVHVGRQADGARSPGVALQDELLVLLLAVVALGTDNPATAPLEALQALCAHAERCPAGALVLELLVKVLHGIRQHTLSAVADIGCTHDGGRAVVETERGDVHLAPSSKNGCHVLLLQTAKLPTRLVHELACRKASVQEGLALVDREAPR